MKPKIHTPSPSESLGDLPSQKQSGGPPERMGRKVEGRRNWRDGSMIGQRFGSLTVVGKALPTKHSGTAMVPCLCECGDQVLCWSNYLPRSKSCLKCSAIHLHSHGKSESSEYKTWLSMKQRCQNPNNKGYKHYGGRGIRVCDRWLSFENFIIDMGKRPSTSHSIDRINNNLGYSPENCKWATRKEQNRNRRNVRLINLSGETKTLSEWAEKSMFSYLTVYKRIVSGWDAESALFSHSPKNHV